MRVLCFGLILVDLLAVGVEKLPTVFEGTTACEYTKTAVGGGAINSAVAFSKFGVETDLLGRIGRDSLGIVVRRFLRRTPVRSRVIVDSERSTGSSLVLVSKTSQKTAIVSRGANDGIVKEDFNGVILQDYDMLLINGFFQFPNVVKDLPKILARAKKLGVTVAFDTAGWDTTERWFEQIRPFAKYIDYFFPNDIQVKKLGGSDDIEVAANNLLKEGVGCVVVKCGENGCIVYRNGVEPLKTDGYKVAPIDTTGAGDCFDAAFLTCKADGKSDKYASRFANVAAAINCTHVGACEGVPEKDFVERIMKLEGYRC